ncbi:hypothetical protein GCM10010358_12930 [Streptomyces minutiscleroticus]|uniref:Uncharacterized protein n=1 Tax=Streptomyces minutiscleroticus TaxID=68238 RepID=A0A918KGE8_9ACTN|nr:hypothetical protein GCM10010358_12930 [Streptomyces minutiscleroticus]
MVGQFTQPGLTAVGEGGEHGGAVPQSLGQFAYQPSPYGGDRRELPDDIAESLVVHAAAHRFPARMDPPPTRAKFARAI